MAKLGLGRNNPVPFRVGGGRSTIGTVYEQLTEKLSKVWKDDPAKESDAWGWAVATAMVWGAGARLANQGNPEKMIDALPDWEEAGLIRPTPADEDVTRRQAVTSKLRGITGNGIPDIADACEALLGACYVGVGLFDPAQTVTYWPRQNPGPPGFEWASTRAVVLVTVTRAGLNDDRFYALMNQLELMLDALLPSWMTFQWAVDTGGFYAGISAVGEVAF